MGCEATPLCYAMLTTCSGVFAGSADTSACFYFPVWEYWSSCSFSLKTPRLTFKPSSRRHLCFARSNL